jgi:hypothetical protein
MTYSRSGKLLKVPMLSLLTAKSTFADINEQLNLLETQSIDNLLWSDNAYKPCVSFVIGNSTHSIYLRYTVFEDDISAHYTQNNDPVFEDTCVEFFIAIGNDSRYYNIEFNRIGTCLMAYSDGRNSINHLPLDIVDEIRTQSEILPAGMGFKYGWQLTVMIPLTAFIYHVGIDVNNLACRGNFYKCGDKLEKRHFLSWSKIEFTTPNFHKPNFFGILLFNSAIQLKQRAGS